MHCNITQATTVKVRVWVLRHTTPLTKVKVKVYAGSHQRALRKGSQLVLTLARAPPNKTRKKTEEEPAGCQLCDPLDPPSGSHGWLLVERLALLKPAALPVTPPSDPPLSLLLLRCICPLPTLISF